MKYQRIFQGDDERRKEKDPFSGIFGRGQKVK
jgi:hypothetical protein